MWPHKPRTPRLVQGKSEDLQKEIKEVRINKNIANVKKKKKKKKKDSLLLTGNLEFSRAIRRIEEVSILVVAHVIMDTLDTLYIRTPLTCIQKPFISS